MTEQGNDVSRRGFIQRAGVAAAAAGVTGLGPAAAAQAAQSGREAPAGPPFQPRGPLRQRPNILLILADEYRYPVAYESAELQDFRARYLTAEESLREDGLEFANHYVMSAACVPSRSSIFTGQYPSLHGVSQTTGAAKSSFEMDMYWLDPDTVPTMGDYFEAGGYDTYYKGKWHVSEADIPIPGTHNAVLTFDDKGLPDPETEAVYLAADRLADFGFHGWIGPEPHGSNPLNSGSSAAGAIGRDEKFATQAVDLLHELAARGRQRPAVADGQLLRQPARHHYVGRTHPAVAELEPARPARRQRRAGPAVRPGPVRGHQPRGPVRQAALPAQLHRDVPADAPADLQHAGLPPVLLPAAAEREPADPAGPGRAARPPGDGREHDRHLHLRPRRDARRARRDVPEVASGV